MLKERAKDFDWGQDIGPNHLHSGTSIGLWTSSLEQFGFDTMSNMKTEHNEYMANASIAMPHEYYPETFASIADGFERFESTERKRPLFNNCDHLKTSGVNYPVTFIGPSYRASLWNAYVFYRFYPDQFGGTFNADIAPVARHMNVDLRNAQATAWGTMQPRFEGQVSMFNFLLELKDFKSLLTLLRNKPWKKMGRYFRKIKLKAAKVRRFKSPLNKHDSVLTQLDLSKPLAQSYLMNEFALKPLVSDIIKITSQIDDVVQKAQQDFSDAGSGRSSRHYSETFEGYYLSTKSSTYVKYAPNMDCGEQKNLTFVATMDYSYNYSMRSQLDAFIKYWGLNPTPEAIWNAIPFSFLVDYFLGVGDAIRIMGRDKHVELSLSQYCESQLTQSSSGTFVKPDNLLHGFIGPVTAELADLPTTDILVSGVTSSLYSRRTTSPNKGLVIPRLKIPSGKQGWNSAALLRCFF